MIMRLIYIVTLLTINIKINPKKKMWKYFLKYNILVFLLRIKFLFYYQYYNDILLKILLSIYIIPN